MRDRDDAYVRLATQAFVPNPVTYLTEGDQTSFELVSGHRVVLKGAGEFELPARFTGAQLVELLGRAGEAEPEQDLSDSMCAAGNIGNKTVRGHG